MMAIYRDYILPRLIHSSCSSSMFKPLRKKIVPQAEGRVLEIGIGSGVNLGYYRQDKIDHFWGLEPSAALRQMTTDRNNNAVPLELLAASAESIPLEDKSADTIVMTFTLCSIGDTKTALSEMRRVLKPGGKLLFCEHGRSPEAHIMRWQDRINPAWKWFGGGCNINRPIIDLISGNGWKIDNQDAKYLDTFKLVSYVSWGSASKR